MFLLNKLSHILLMAVISFGFFGCDKNQEKKPAQSAAVEVDIIVGDAPLKIPEELQKVFQALGIKGIITVDGEEKLRLLRPNGEYINPCASEETAYSKERECQKNLTFENLISYAVSGSGNTCGKCEVSGKKKWCDKTATQEPKRPCSDPQTQSCQGNPCE